MTLKINTDPEKLVNDDLNGMNKFSLFNILIWW